MGHRVQLVFIAPFARRDSQKEEAEVVYEMVTLRDQGFLIDAEFRLAFARTIQCAQACSEGMVVPQHTSGPVAAGHPRR